MSEGVIYEQHHTYWQIVWNRLKRHLLGMSALFVVVIFCLVGIYAPLLASSKPLVVHYQGSWYFPLFRYLFYTGFYTKKIDLFFNLLMFTFPFLWLSVYSFKHHLRLRKMLFGLLLGIQIGLFFLFSCGVVKDPAAAPLLNSARQQVVQDAIKESGHAPYPSWEFDLRYMNNYAKLNLLLSHEQRKTQYDRLTKQQANCMATLHQMSQQQRAQMLQTLDEKINSYQKAGKTASQSYLMALSKKAYIIDRQQWIANESKQIGFILMPLIRPFHWEEDAGGNQCLNQLSTWTDLTRINRKDLVAALLFGVRISLVVGITAVALALLIGVPFGACAGYYGGNFDIVLSRLLEIWESLPTFFMLLLVVAITQSKSIFLIISVIGIFGWTSFSRYIRGEFFKQRNLSYVEACMAAGFSDRYIIFSHILPNAFPPLLTLLPFAIMGAITSEAGLSFLGLGEEESCSWGVLMDEGRTAFPGESYLLWPPALLLTVLLIAIALVGDALRDALDPKG